MTRMILAAVVALSVAAPAFAHQCPMLMGLIEEALASGTADEATKGQASKLLEEGRALHEAGDHAGSEAKLGQAMALLGIAG